MAVQLTIEFSSLVELVDQLKPAEQYILLKHLQEKLGQSMTNEKEFRDRSGRLLTDNNSAAPEDSLSKETLYGDER